MREARSAIRDARKRKKLTQAQLARLANVDSITISRWERHEFKPSSENLIRLSKALGVDPSTLLGRK